MDDRPINRRSFFRQGLLELVKRIQQAAEPLAEAAKQFNELEQPHPTTTPTEYPPYTYPGATEQKHWIRPPGALPEDQFMGQCCRSGECVRVCPVQCIKIDYSGQDGGGAPYILAESQACTLCDGLLCMHSCPTGALQSTDKQDINMGRAVVHYDRCLRTIGQECSICVDKCPLGSAAIQIISGSVQVMDPGCVGCGTCEQECPTYPRSITVTPRSELAKPDTAD